MVLLAVTACKKGPQEDPTPSCVGEWQMSNIEVKSVSYAGQTLDVYLAFREDGSFELYQMMGQGRFRKYSGQWTLEGNVLSGKYSSKKPWGSTYEVSADGETLTLTSVESGEKDTYQKTTIPESVKQEAYEI